MKEILTPFMLGLSLSVDAFSLLIIISTIISKKKIYMLISLIGILHFTMPILGALIGFKTSEIVNINGNIILGLILVILSIQILISIYKKENYDIVFSNFEILLLAFGVSIDSLTVGFGMSFDNIFSLYSPIVFFMLSILISYLGYYIGKYSSFIFEKNIKFVAALFLLIFGFYKIVM